MEESDLVPVGTFYNKRVFMKTELLKVDPSIVGGSQIEVVEYSIRNYRLHQVVEQMSRLFIFCVECDSNNTLSKVTPRDARRIMSQWSIIKSELDFSLDHNDYPRGSHEYAYIICLIDQKEIQKIRNVKMKRIVSEMFNTARVILSVDSAQTQGSIASDDAADIKEMFHLVDNCLARWIGSGMSFDDVGIQSPAYEEIGEVVPDVDGDYAQILEPSKAMPAPKLPDVADTATV